MKLADVQKKEDCFDGSSIFEYIFDAEAGEPLVRLVAGDGRLYLYTHFPRPFFKIIMPDGVQVKGILGDRSIEAVFPQTGKEEIKAAFERRLRLCLEEGAAS